MKHIFVDTNVIIDFLTEREPFVESATILFTLAVQGDIKAYISSLSFTNLYYVFRKVAGRDKALKLLKDIKIITTVLEVNSSIIEQALNSNFKDFEDAVQHFTALHANNIEAIITRNTSDYQQSQIPVFTPDEFLKWFTQNPK